MCACVFVESEFLFVLFIIELEIWAKGRSPSAGPGPVGCRSLRVRTPTGTRLGRYPRIAPSAFVVLLCLFTVSKRSVFAMYSMSLRCSWFLVVAPVLYQELYCCASSCCIALFVPFSSLLPVLPVSVHVVLGRLVFFRRTVCMSLLHAGCAFVGVLPACLPFESESCPCCCVSSCSILFVAVCLPLFASAMVGLQAAVCGTAPHW